VPSLDASSTALGARSGWSAARRASPRAAEDLLAMAEAGSLSDFQQARAEMVRAARFCHKPKQRCPATAAEGRQTSRGPEN
jgi:hypothetical protein